VSLVKSGIGTATISTPVAIGANVGQNTLSAVTINAGQILSANAVAPSSNGTLAVGNVLGLGSAPSITLAGGILNLTTSVDDELINSQRGSQYGSGSGYSLTVAASNNFGQANTTSTVNGPFVTNQTTNSNAAFVGSLTVNSAAFGFTGGSAAQQGGGVIVN